MLTPAVVLEELMRLREAPSSDTATFTWTHEQLCETCRTQIEEMGDSFLKYHHVTYNVQGPRDQGVDVLLKTLDPADGLDDFIGVQIKSYKELDDKDSDLSKQLKAGYHDARQHYGSRLVRYYIALCGDAKKHAKRISAITAEFSKEPAVRVIGPRHLLTFMTLSSTVLAAVVDRCLTQDDYVRKKAREEVKGYTNAEIYFLLSCLAYAFTSGSDQLPEEYFEREFDEQSFATKFGPEAFHNALSRFQDSALEVYAAPSSTRVRLELFTAIRALYYDVQVRYDEDPSDRFRHLYEFLKV